MVIRLTQATNQEPPEFPALIASTPIAELKDVANAVKHADSPAATRLRLIRPDLFVNPLLRDSPLGRHVRTLANPLGGTDLFLSENDLTLYRDAMREFWERVIPSFD